jgi:hypothetical protein
MTLVRRVRALHAQRKAATQAAKEADQAAKVAHADFWATTADIREFCAQHGLSGRDFSCIATGHYGGKR